MQRVKAYNGIVHLDHTLDTLMAGDAALPAFKPDSEDARPLNDKPILVCVTDQGPDLQSGSWFLQYAVKLRCLWLYDPRHRLIAEQEAGLREAGLAASIKLSEMLLSFQRGPWSEQRWFQTLSEESQEVLRSMLHEKDNYILAQELLPRIAREQQLPEAEVTVDCLAKLLAEASFRSSRGESNTSRWDSWHKGMEARLPEFGLMLLVCMSYGFKMNYFEKNQGGDHARLGSSLTDENEQKEQLKTKAFKKENLFRNCQNKLHVVTMCLLDDELMQDITVWYYCSKCMSEELRDLRTRRGPNGCLEWHRDESNGKPLQLVNTALALPCKSDVLSRCGLTCPEDVAGNAGFTFMPFDHPYIANEQRLYRLIVKTSMSVAKVKLRNVAHAMFSFPLSFVALTVPALQAGMLEYMELVWQAWKYLEEFNTPYWKALKARSPLQLTLVRDVFMECHRESFKKVPDHVTHTLTELFSHLLCSWNEEGFNTMRGMEKFENKATSKMSSTDLWINLGESQIFQSYGYSEIEPDRTRLVDDLPSSLYNVKKREVKLKESKEIISQHSATWPSMQYLHSSVLPGELVFMTQCFLQKNHAAAGAAWRSAFLVAGLLVQEQGATTTWLSLGPLQKNNSALLVRMQEVKGTDKATYWQPCKLVRPNLVQFVKDPTSATFRYVVVTDFSKWKVVPAEVLSPVQQGILQRKAGKTLSIPWPPPGGWTQRGTSATTPLLKHLAQQGFYNIGKKDLQKLLKAESHAFIHVTCVSQNII